MGADVPPDPNSGAAGTVYRTNEALRALGHRVEEFWSEDLGRRIAHGNLHYLLELPRAYRRETLKRLARADYDVVQLSQPHAWLAARELRRRHWRGAFVNRSHGLELRAHAELARWYQAEGIPQARRGLGALSRWIGRRLDDHWQRVCDYADGIIVSCELDREYLLHRVSVEPKRVRVIHHGVDEDFVRQQPERGRDYKKKLQVLYVGQYAFIKGPHVLARAMNLLAERGVDFHVSWVCGEADHPSVLGQLSHDARSRVHLYPWMSRDRLVEVYDAHDIFVFPSLFEGAGKASLEAMARGLAVVTTPVGAMSDYITDGVDGSLVGPGDHDALADSLAVLLENPERVREMGECARRRAASFTWPRCASNAVSFYREILSA